MGVVWLVWLLLKIVKFLVEEFHAFVLAPRGVLRTDLKQYGQWAGNYNPASRSIIHVCLAICEPNLDKELLAAIHFAFFIFDWSSVRHGLP